MKQCSHAWIALRALKLIDDLVAEGGLPQGVKRLNELLFNYLPDVYEGAWIPDTLIGDMATGHIFKMDLLPDDPSGRFTVDYKSLSQRLGGKRRSLELAKDNDVLTKPYKAHASGGKLPNRVLSVSNSLSDMLKLSEFPFGQYTKVKKARAYRSESGYSSTRIKALDLAPNFTGRQIALTYFLLSHYIVDGHMPLHCDVRDMSYDNKRKIFKGLHAKLESYWETHMLGDTVFLVLPTLSLDEAVKRLPEGSIFAPISDGVELFDFHPLAAGRDEWEEMVDACRVSFALSRHLIPDQAQEVEDIVQFRSQQELEEASRAIFSDAVATVAAIWVKSWMDYVE
jgi:hypothetical protein